MRRIWRTPVVPTLAWLLACLLLSAQVNAAERRLVVVGVHESYPWSYSGAGNVIRGIEHDIIAAAFESQNIDVQFQSMSYSRLLTEFQGKRLDFASPVAIDVPGAFFTEKYLPFHDVAVTLKSRGIAIDRVSDLSNKTVIAYQEATKVLGAEYSAAVSTSRYTEMANRGEQIRLLFDQRVDVVVGESRLSQCLAEVLFGRDQLTRHTVFPQVSYGGATWDRKLLDQFQAGLKAIRLTGQYQRILSRPCPPLQ
ncbi:transporter substrate-binding domain-containing protein [Curvibacter sp. APW13]|uniref:substrate-binding periplasmic protein n=1 Tax=Curvibacter sp. APW13 TaxID=3077236 RepID=UPI0028DED00D|nr:transporter substrate-binding domain-containing protein [Curvibacter sp. APW13]MDT8989685.1 transporter substrate-binding domain-containing protein [Curvibacter sp. APW13]